MTTKNRLILKKCFDEYFNIGGFPEVRNVSDKIRLMIHQEYYKAILHRDVIERFNAIHPQAVILAGYRLISSAGSLYSINRMTSYLKSMGHKISKGFVSDCIDWFEDAYFLFSLKIFSESVAIQNVNAKKVYCVDHSMVRSVASGISTDSGHLLENIIFLHLRRKTERLYYYRTGNGKEIDFLWLDARKKKHLVQVCFSLADPSTAKREIASLTRAMEELHLTEATIVTLDEDQQIDSDGKKIRIIPAWKFLISDG